MKIGEVCLITNDVVSLADFYKTLFGIENGSNDEVHQILLAEETQFTIYNDGSKGNDSSQNTRNPNITLAFTVADLDSEYERLLSMGVKIIEKPTKRPWGAVNMSFYDQDGNVIYFRSFAQ